MRFLHCGFEADSTDCIDSVVSGGGVGGITIATGTANARPGGSVYALTLTLPASSGGVPTATCTWNFTAVTELYMRVGFRLNALNWLVSQDTDLITFGNGAGTQMSLGLHTDSINAALASLTIRRNGTKLLTDGGVLNYNQYYLIEMHVNIDPTTGVCTVRRDGSTVMDFSGNTRGQGDNNISNVALCANAPSVNRYMTVAYDDLALNDTTGTLNNTWIGDGSIIGVAPSAAGDLTQLALTGAASNYIAVQEIPPDDDTSYVSSSTSGQADLYQLADLPAAAIAVSAVVVWNRVKKMDAGAVQIYSPIKSGGTENDGTAQTPTATYSYMRRVLDSNPVSTAAWTVTDINALQVGTKIV